jgi:hypothetical protein
MEIAEFGLRIADLRRHRVKILEYWSGVIFESIWPAQGISGSRIPLYLAPWTSFLFGGES